MQTMQHPTTHRAWEDWAVMIVGGLAIVSPAIDMHATSANPYILLNSIAVGFLVLSMAMLELQEIERWDEKVNLIAGLWLAASPFLFGYGGALLFVHLVLGAIIALFAAFELWQDRNIDSVAN